MSFGKPDLILPRSSKYDLSKDGFVLLPDFISREKIEQWKQLCEKGDYQTVKTTILQDPELDKKIHSLTNDEYQFQDYIWIIQKSAVHTCHRDNNGDFFNPGQKHPSYTMLIYLEDMEKCLGVIPESHLDRHSFNINLTDQVRNVICNKGDILFFNANLIHVGTIQPKRDHLRIQMKVSHKDDLEALSYYENYNKVLKEENRLPDSLRKAQRNLSCMFPILSNLTQKENIQSSRGTVDGVKISWFQQAYSYLFYGNSHFYDLPNAF
jgi:hypothetical protein